MRWRVQAPTLQNSGIEVRFPVVEVLIQCFSNQTTCIVFVWYLHHDLPVTPINPGSETVSALNKDHATVPNVTALSNPTQTSLSVITPPATTLQLLREAKEKGIPSVWLQPGSFDAAVLEFANAPGTFEAVIAGDGGRGHEGWCILVDGERGLQAAGKL